MELSFIVEKLFKALEWLVMIGLLVGSVFFVKDVWIKYQSGDTSIKVSTKELRNFNDKPTITICFDPQAKPSALNQYGTNMLEFITTKAKDPNISVPYPEFYHAAVYRIGIDFNITLKLHENNYILLIDNENIPEKISQIIEFEVIYTLWLGLCYRITQKIHVEEDLMNTIVIDFNESMPEEDIPEYVDVFFTSEDNPYGVISLKWIDGKELLFRLNPRKDYFYYTDLTIRQYNYAKKQKSTGQLSCTIKTAYECITFG